MRIIWSLLAMMAMPGMLLVEERTSLKFDFVDRSLIVIPVFVNETGPYRFLVDTGASTSVMAMKLAKRLNLPIGRTDSLFSAGGPLRVEIRKLETMRVGEIRIKGAEIAVADIGLMGNLGVDGILGADHLKSFSVSIDYSKQLLLLERA